MKTVKLLSVLFIFLLYGCSKSDVQYRVLTTATPITMSLDEFRSSAKVEAARTISQSGKMYVYGKYVFVNDVEQGIHVIDNTNPASPQIISFLNVPGNVDISVKNDILYADSFMDLVYFDISEINSITYTGRVEDVLPRHYNWPDAEYYATDDVDFENDMIIDWVITSELHVVDYTSSEDIFQNTSGTESGDLFGTGGSLARFKIVEDHLYAVDQFQINVFDITNLTQPLYTGASQVGWQIETIFSDNEYLYIGSNSGMFIYDLANPASPQYVSEVSHILGCDPVVVQGDYAYVTIRGGNNCEQNISQLDVVNISDRFNPFIATSLTMQEPYGLGVRNDELYVSDGAAGLKLFDVSTPEDISLLTTFPDLVIFDVIPLEDQLLLIGNNTLYQYEYGDGELILISTLALN